MQRLVLELFLIVSRETVEFLRDLARFASVDSLSNTSFHGPILFHAYLCTAYTEIYTRPGILSANRCTIHRSQRIDSAFLFYEIAGCFQTWHSAYLLWKTVLESLLRLRKRLFA